MSSIQPAHGIPEVAPGGGLRQHELLGGVTDRRGGGPMVLAGSLLLTVATVPFMFVTAHASYVLLAGVLLVRGLGLGATVQPSVAVAYQALDSVQVPRATAALNTVRQIGGSIGTTLLAVILQHEAWMTLASRGSPATALLAPLPNAERIRLSGPISHAFAHTFLWALLIALLTVVPAVVLIRAERTYRRRQHGTVGSQTGESDPALLRTRAA